MMCCLRGSMQLSVVSSSFVRRLQLLEEFNMLMSAMQRSEAVVGYFRTLVADLPPADAPVSWWDVEADVGLLAGIYKHGYNNFEEIRRDPDMVLAFQVSTSTRWGGGGGGGGGVPQAGSPIKDIQGKKQHESIPFPYTLIPLRVGTECAFIDCGTAPQGQQLSLRGAIFSVTSEV